MSAYYILYTVLTTLYVMTFNPHNYLTKEALLLLSQFAISKNNNNQKKYPSAYIDILIVHSLLFQDLNKNSKEICFNWGNKKEI